MIAADVAHVLSTSIADLKRERLPSLLAWHEEARRIAAARYPSTRRRR